MFDYSAVINIFRTGNPPPHVVFVGRRLVLSFVPLDGDRFAEGAGAAAHVVVALGAQHARQQIVVRSRIRDAGRSDCAPLVLQRSRFNEMSPSGSIIDCASQGIASVYRES